MWYSFIVGSMGNLFEREAIDPHLAYYRNLVAFWGLIPEKDAQTLQLSVYTIECDHCSQKIQLAKLSCGHRICIDCLDCLIDMKTEICPLCSKQIDTFDYIV